MSRRKTDDVSDVTWGDNVIYANFSGGTQRGRATSRNRSSSTPDRALAEPVRKLVDSTSWAGANAQVVTGIGRKPMRGSRSVVKPRTAFAQWTWEFICRGADEGRKTRGEKYFQQDKVIGERIGDGFCIGDVQGSQLEPFSALIRLPHRDDTNMRKILQWLVDNPSKMNAFEQGELPFAQMEALIADRDEHLFCECSCPDPYPVCKHIIALGAQLVSRIDDNPMTMLELRGMSQQELQRKISGLVRMKTAKQKKKIALLRNDNHEPQRTDACDSRLHLPDGFLESMPVGAPTKAPVPGENSAATSEEQMPTAIEADFWGDDLPRVETPALKPIDLLKNTDQSLLHDALQPTCVISRETLRAVAELEECWNHLKNSASLSEKTQLGVQQW